MRQLSGMWRPQAEEQAAVCCCGPSTLRTRLVASVMFVCFSASALLQQSEIGQQMAD